MLGLSVFLYYPLRSPNAPFGPTDITSLDAFIHFVSAEGLRVNLFYYGLSDQLTRFGVFFELLKLQYSIIGILLVIPGVIWLARKAWKPFVLCAVFFLSLYLFIINTVQDVMAYLMLPFMMIAVFSGLGAWAMVTLTAGFQHFGKASEQTQRSKDHLAVKTWQVLILAALLLLPIVQLISTYPRVSLSDYTAGGDWVNTRLRSLRGQRRTRGAARAVGGDHALVGGAVYRRTRARTEADVKPVYVTTASQNPWLDNVFAHLNEGPVYLADYRRPVVEGRLFRLAARRMRCGAWCRRAIRACRRSITR